MRAFLIVLDSVGVGEAPDASAYGDSGANTLAHTAASAGGLHMPTLTTWGLGCIPSLLPAGIPFAGIPPVPHPIASYGAMQEVSRGKDTTTGHWEMAGLELTRGFALFPPGPPSFPGELISEFAKLTGRPVIGNRAASGTRIIEELGPEQMKTGAWIVYTSADSVFQIAAHEEVIPLPELYHGCEIARKLCDPLMVGRIIARPFTGKPGAFTRTGNRRDFSFPLPEPCILDLVSDAGLPVAAVGKIDDVFPGHDFARKVHVENNPDAESATLDIATNLSKGLVFVNLIDFDMLYGHRRDPAGYAGALEKADVFIGNLAAVLHKSDLLIVTADHGNDPTFKGTDHTREWVPLLVYQPDRAGASLGLRKGFFDIAQSLACFFGLPRMPRGVSFVPANATLSTQE